MRSHLESRSPVSRSLPGLTLALVLAGLGGLGMTCNKPPPPDIFPVGFETFTSPQSRPLALSPDGAFLYVANTTSDSVSVINTTTFGTVAIIPVGMEPVSVAVKPDGSELWVSNHVSDSVSVIDLSVSSPTLFRVVETIQDLDADGVSQFDEPVGIAFASNAKAYVALSSRNDVAIVDTATYTVTGRIHITSQEPRSLYVMGGKLYVAAFESGNQSELSVCPNGGSAPQCTLDTDDIVDFVIQSPNIPTSDTRIVRDPDLPDRDLFVIDTATDTLDESVSGISTLLYEVVASSTGEVFITQAEARNDVNGEDGENLIELDNRMFLNQIGRVSCGGGCGAPSVIELEPLPPAQPAAGTQLATPYGLALSGNDATLVATAAGTSRVFTMNAASGAVLDILDLDAGVPADFGQQIPKGVALYSDGTGAPMTAYVLNTLENTVSVVDVSNPSAITHTTKIPVGADPTPDPVRRGRIAFSNAFASSTGTFSCESCHPDGNMDQLLWRIGGACFHAGCTGDDEIRSTMPVRGLKNTLPLHWDGTLGDPFGGGNGAVGTGGSGGTDCTLGDADGDHDCFVDLVMASLSGVMCDQTGNCPPGGNELTAQERDDMAFFLASVSYPPARSRRPDDAVTASAKQGFADFFMDVGGLGGLVGVTTCADMNSGCHALPLQADTNSSTLGAFDVPTMRGMTDRWLHFSIGITNPEEVLEFVKSPQTFNLPGLPIQLNAPATEVPFDFDEGMEEDVTFAAAFFIFQPVYGKGPLDMFQMFEEASTGHSGAVGRQVTLNSATGQAPLLTDTEEVLDVLEAADADDLVRLVARGWRNGASLNLDYDAVTDAYVGSGLSLSRATLIADAVAGTALLTFTGNLPQNVGDDDYRQPLLSVRGTGNGSTGNPDLPVLPGDNPMQLRGIDVRGDAQILVDGQVVAGSISCDPPGGFAPYCESEDIVVDLTSLPGNGLRLLQVQNPEGPLSNELPICVGAVGGCI